mmetsp:Transcript_106898/g.309243  ORF Transcript_106898/g.309243 Transcript_106898/m.309243 type:complete len:205 (-) Transcript_106898:661-1275(-)
MAGQSCGSSYMRRSLLIKYACAKLHTSMAAYNEIGIRLLYKMKKVNQYPNQSGNNIESLPVPSGNKYQYSQNVLCDKQYIMSLSSANKACVPNTISIARFTTRSKLASFIGVFDEFLAMRVSWPAYTTTPKHQAVFFSCVPRSSKLSAFNACLELPLPSRLIRREPTNVWMDFDGGSASTTAWSAARPSTAMFSNGGPPPSSAE